MHGVSLENVAQQLSEYEIKLFQDSMMRFKLVSSVTVLEVDNPDTAWLLGGEFVLSSLSMCNSSNELIDIINDLSLNGSSALAIHNSKGREILVDESVVSHANDVGIPLFLIPTEIPYSSILTTMYSMILESESKYLFELEKINNAITKCLLEEDVLRSIVQTLSKLLNKTVVVLNEYFRIEESAVHDEDGSKFVSYIEMGNLYEYFRKLKNDTSRNTIFEDTIHFEGYSYKQILYRVFTNGFYPYNIIVWHDELSEDADNKIDIIALDYASRALKITYKKSVRDTGFTMETDAFYNYLISENFEWNESRAAIAVKRKIPIEGYHRVIKVVIKECDNIQFNRIQKKVKRMMGWLTNNTEAKYYMIPGDKTIVVFQQFHNINKADCEALTKVAGKFIYEELSSFEGEGCYYVCMGILVNHIKETKRSLESARRTLFMAQKVYRKPGIYSFDQLGIYSIIGVESIEDLKDNCRIELEIIRSILGKNQEILLDTLEAYYDCSENLADTAAYLDIHINTVKYRMNKLKQLLGDEIVKSGDEKLKLHLLIKYGKLL